MDLSSLEKRVRALEVDADFEQTGFKPPPPPQSAPADASLVAKLEAENAQLRKDLARAAPRPAERGPRRTGAVSRLWRTAPSRVSAH